MVPRTPGPWPDRAETDQRCIGYLWVPSDEVFLPAVAEVTRAALLVAGPTVHPTPVLVELVADLAAQLLPWARDERSWLLELETDDSDVFVRLWLPLRSADRVALTARSTTALDGYAGSYHLDQEGDRVLVVVQLALQS